MSQNVWATIMPYGPVTNFLLAQKKRNDASPSDGDNKRLVCVRGDQCHNYIKDIRKRVD
jgi:hypothetical protein